MNLTFCFVIMFSKILFIYLHNHTVFFVYIYRNPISDYYESIEIYDTYLYS